MIIARNIQQRERERESRGSEDGEKWELKLCEFLRGVEMACIRNIDVELKKDKRNI